MTHLALAVSFRAIQQAVHLHTTSLENHAIPAFIRILLVTKLTQSDHKKNLRLAKYKLYQAL